MDHSKWLATNNNPLLQSSVQRGQFLLCPVHWQSLLLKVPLKALMILFFRGLRGSLIEHSPRPHSSRWSCFFCVRRSFSRSPSTVNLHCPPLGRQWAVRTPFSSKGRTSSGYNYTASLQQRRARPEAGVQPTAHRGPTGSPMTNHHNRPGWLSEANISIAGYVSSLVQPISTESRKP